MRNINLILIKYSYTILFVRYRLFISRYFRKLFVKFFYYERTGKYLNLSNPKDLNQKLLSLNLKDNSLRSKCTDKYEVRSFLKSLGMNSILNELYGVYDNVDQVDFDKLPNQFVIKANHGCGYNIICKDKSDFDVQNAKMRLIKWLNEIYGLSTGEWHYARIKPRIIIERYLPSLDNNKSLIDYKFHCINGNVEWILVTYDRTENNVKLASYDLEWNKIYFLKNESEDIIPPPSSLQQMIQIANQIAKYFQFVRVDLYDSKGEIYFGELTFTPAASVMSYYKDEILERYR